MMSHHKEEAGLGDHEDHAMLLADVQPSVV